MCYTLLCKHVSVTVLLMVCISAATQKMMGLLQHKASVSGIMSKDRTVSISLFFLGISQLLVLLVAGSS